MLLYLAPIDQTPNDLALVALLTEHCGTSMHQIVADPGTAEMHVLVGDFAHQPNLLLEHPVFTDAPKTTCVFTQEDAYLPLLPGVYKTVADDESARLGRTVAFGPLDPADGSLLTKVVIGCIAALLASRHHEEHFIAQWPQMLAEFNAGATRRYS